MGLKRKRSDSEISCTSTLLSSPQSVTTGMSLDGLGHGQYPVPTPSLFSARTRKRYRDNRPSESDVHEHTLSLLFGAQQPSIAAPHPMPVPTVTRPAHVPSSRQQISLHSFWALPSSRSLSSSSSSSSSSPTQDFPPRSPSPSICSSCDAHLHSSSTSPGTSADAMDVDIDIDIIMMTDHRSRSGTHACSECGKHVCHGCAVSNLGDARRCLDCAGRGTAGRGRRWIGGLGWC